MSLPPLKLLGNFRTLTLLQTSKTMSQILQIHAQLITTNFINDPLITSQLLYTLTSKSLNITYAETLFTQILEPKTIMYNTMIKSLMLNSKPKRVFDYYIKMRRNGLLGDFYTYPFVLKACVDPTILYTTRECDGKRNGGWEGRQVHGEIVKGGFEWDVFVRNGLIGMYCRVRKMDFSRMLFDGFSGKDIVSWNLMLSGYVRCGELGNAEKLFDGMLERDVVSWSVMIDGYKVCTFIASRLVK